MELDRVLKETHRMHELELRTLREENRVLRGEGPAHSKHRERGGIRVQSIDEVDSRHEHEKNDLKQQLTEALSKSLELQEALDKLNAKYSLPTIEDPMISTTPYGA